MGDSSVGRARKKHFVNFSLFFLKKLFFDYLDKTLRGRAVVARLAHNQEVAGSNPAPASIFLILYLYLMYFRINIFEESEEALKSLPATSMY